MDAYERAFSRMMVVEGYQSDHPDDPGGLTVYGISRNHHPEIYRDGIPSIDDAKAFYRREFWNPLFCDLWRPELANRLFDAGVNVGRGRAVRWFQEGINEFLPSRYTPLVIDGGLGPLTRRAATHILPGLSTNLTGWLTWRQGHYYNVEMRRELYRSFGRGLWRRLGIPF